MGFETVNQKRVENKTNFLTNYCGKKGIKTSENMGIMVYHADITAK